MMTLSVIYLVVNAVVLLLMDGGMMGGKPSTATPKDGRLKGNKPPRPKGK